MQPELQINVKPLFPDARLPFYATASAACADVYAYLPGGNGSQLTLLPGSRVIVGLGIAIELPPGYEMQVRSRSGLAAKSGVLVLNSPGTIDADYRGEVCAVLHNTSDEPFIITHGDRVAQVAIKETLTVAYVAVDELSSTTRGEGGFGSTGV